MSADGIDDSACNIKPSAIKDRAALFGGSKPPVMNKPGKSVLNRFPQAVANDVSETKTYSGGTDVHTPNKFTSPSHTGDKPSPFGDKKTPPPVFNRFAANKTEKSPLPPPVEEKSPVPPPVKERSPVPPPVKEKSPVPPPVAGRSPAPPAVSKKTPGGLANNKVWTPPGVKDEINKPAKDHNDNVKSFQNKSEGGNKVTSSSSFQDKTDTPRVPDKSDKSVSDGTFSETQQGKKNNISEGSEILANLKNQLRSTKTYSRSSDIVKVTFQSNHVQKPGDTTDSKSEENNEILRKKSTKKRISRMAVKSRNCDDKKFKLISKGTLISNHNAPMKPRRPANIDITTIVEEYQKAVQELFYEDEDLYDDVESFARGSCPANRISLIPDMTEEEELGSDQTSGSGSASASASGSGGGFKLIQETNDNDSAIVEGEMDQVYEEFVDDVDDAAAKDAKKEKEEKERAEKEKKEKLKREKEEKKKKEAARKEQEKKEKAEKAEKLKQEKERLAKEKKERERKEKEEKEKKKRQKSETAEETSNKGSSNDGETELEYDDCAVAVQGEMEEEYADVDDYVSASSSSQSTEKEKEEKEDKKKKEAARKEEERKKKEKLKEEKERLAKEKKEREKKEKEEKELKKKFKLTGTEEKVSSGVILEDAKGGKLDLAVVKGAQVDIMRMNNNPTGKFLVKTEDNKWGYVESNNIQIDTESIKEVTQRL